MIIAVSIADRYSDIFIFKVNNSVLVFGVGSILHIKLNFHMQ